MMARRLAKRSPWWDIAFDVLLVGVLIIAVVNQFQLRGEIHARQNAAYRNCLASNDARQVVVNILAASEKLVNQAPSISPEQKKNSDKFYEDQIDKIKFSDCTPFKTG
jgi:hypothetical protein